MFCLSSGRAWDYSHHHHQLFLGSSVHHRGKAKNSNSIGYRFWSLFWHTHVTFVRHMTSRGHNCAKWFTGRDVLRGLTWGASSFWRGSCIPPDLVLPRFGTDLCDLCAPGLLNGFIHLEFSLLEPFIPRIHRIAFVFLAKILLKHFLAIDTYSPKLRSIVFTLVDLAALSHRVTKLKFFRDIRLFDMLSVWYPLENEHIIDEVIRYHK